MRTQLRPATWCFYATLLCACSGNDSAAPEPGFVIVSTRSALAATDNLDWGDLGPPSGGVPQPLTIRSDDGLSVVVTNTSDPPSASPTPFRRAQQNFFGGWRGNFTLGDELIYTGSAQVITVDFPSPIVVAGTQVQPGSLIVQFTTRIEALSADGAVLVFFDVVGLSTNAEDNSAPFVGIRAIGGASFEKIRISNRTTMALPGIAINRVDFTPAGH
jgi:hypothetical protein